jgi:NTP pyrophosphatase (non-canonical NTP hydrolase)
MASVKSDITIKGFQDFCNEVYGSPNRRDFDLESIHSNVERFGMRALKGIRKKNFAKIKKNLLISLSFFNSMFNLLEINSENIVWNRFPYLCSYCASCPCKCTSEKVQTRRKLVVDDSKKPTTLKEYQQMFEHIYPIYGRTLEEGGIHLAEEIGELSEAIMKFRGTHKEEDLNQVILEMADVFSCMMGILNSLHIDVADELTKLYYDNCHVCHHAPCTCVYEFVMDYES